MNQIGLHIIISPKQLPQSGLSTSIIPPNNNQVIIETKTKTILKENQMYKKKRLSRKQYLRKALDNKVPVKKQPNDNGIYDLLDFDYYNRHKMLYNVDIYYSNQLQNNSKKIKKANNNTRRKCPILTDITNRSNISSVESKQQRIILKKDFVDSSQLDIILSNEQKGLGQKNNYPQSQESKVPINQLILSNSEYKSKGAINNVAQDKINEGTEQNDEKKENSGNKAQINHYRELNYYQQQPLPIDSDFATSSDNSTETTHSISETMFTSSNSENTIFNQVNNGCLVKRLGIRVGPQYQAIIPEMKIDRSEAINKLKFKQYTNIWRKDWSNQTVFQLCLTHLKELFGGKRNDQECANILRQADFNVEQFKKITQYNYNFLMDFFQSLDHKKSNKKKKNQKQIFYRMNICRKN